MKRSIAWKRLTVSSLLWALPLFAVGCGSSAKVGARSTAPSAETLAAESQQLSHDLARFHVTALLACTTAPHTAPNP